MSKKFILLKFLLIVAFGVALVCFLVYAWNPPAAPPPSLNVPPPINVGDMPQSKEGDLNIGKGLKYWITKLGDSFALKNNKGEIKFIVGQDGNVGISVVDPQEKLDVGGNVKVRGALCLKDGCRDKWGDLSGEPVGTLCGIYRPACGACSYLNLPCKGYYVSSGCPPGYRKYKIATCYGSHDCRYNPVYSCIKIK
ncbi:hypothetical protein J7K91_00360 [bacterium]|nr:hypothetical protein [bacterium]